MADYMRLVEFDLEAGPTLNEELSAAVRAKAIAKRPANNTLKELKTLWDTEAAREERAHEALAKTAVDVLLAEPLCVCWAEVLAEDVPNEDVTVQWVDCMSRSGDHAGAQINELYALARHWDEVTGPDTIWVGHNICKYDLPVLTNAWMRNGIEIPRHFPEFIGGRWRGRVFDTMQRVPCGDGYVKLDEACLALGVEPSAACLWCGEEVDGSKVGAMFTAGDYDAIIEYGKADIPPLHGLYRRITSDDTRATYDKGRGVSAQLEELRAAEGMTEGQRLLGVWMALELGGLVKRAA